MQEQDKIDATKPTRYKMIQTLEKHEQLEICSPIELINNLCQYSDNWDNEGSNKPSKAAINNAKEIINWANSNKLNIQDIDADTNGGVAIWLGSNKDCLKRVWISCMNNCTNSILIADHDHIKLSEPLTNINKSAALNFLLDQ